MPAEVILHTLRHAWTTLQKLQLRAALMGGLALSVWKHVRATRDIDLLVSLGSTDADSLVRELARAGFRPRRHPPVLSLGAVRVAQFLYEPEGAFMDLNVDLLLADSAYHQQALSRCVPARLPDLGMEIAVLSCEDVILHKLIAGRIIDKADLVALFRVNRTELDYPYLRQWINRLGLEQECAETWDEAFPGEPLPGSAT